MKILLKLSLIILIIFTSGCSVTSLNTGSVAEIGAVLPTENQKVMKYIDIYPDAKRENEGKNKSLIEQRFQQNDHFPKVKRVTDTLGQEMWETTGIDLFFDEKEYLYYGVLKNVAYDFGSASFELKGHYTYADMDADLRYDLVYLDGDSVISALYCSRTKQKDVFGSDRAPYIFAIGENINNSIVSIGVIIIEYPDNREQEYRESCERFDEKNPNFRFSFFSAKDLMVRRKN